MQLVQKFTFNSSYVKCNSFALLLDIVMQKNSEDCAIKNHITCTSSDVRFLAKSQGDAGLLVKAARRLSCLEN